MLRELMIKVYLILFRFFFNLFNSKELQDKTVFVASFGANIKATMEELERQKADHHIVILKSKNCKAVFDSRPNRTILEFESGSISQFLKSIYHLATAKHIFIDNYYGFLAVTDFREEVKCVQLWHAAGAIKQFGLQDLTNKNRTEEALRRFQRVYNRFDHVVVGSDQMIQIFKESFGLPEERFLRTGIPRTDFFFDDLEKARVVKKIQADFPIIKEKKVILYAPTYRDDELSSTKLQLNFDMMYKHLKHEYVLFLRLHPAVNSQFENKYPGFIYNVSSYQNINHLLLVTDVLISDYSSIPFEFSLLNRPMIFYAYDLDEYAEKRGLWKDYEERVPGPVVYSTDELINVIEQRAFQLEKVRPFAEEWNKYSQGNSSENLVKALYAEPVIEEKQKIREHV